MLSLYRYVCFSGRIFQQIVGIPVGSNCAPLLATYFFIGMSYAWCRSFSRKTRRKQRIILVSLLLYQWCPFIEQFNVLCLCWLDLYPIELETKDITDTSVSYLDIRIEIGGEGSVENETWEIISILSNLLSNNMIV